MLRLASILVALVGLVPVHAQSAPAAQFVCGVGDDETRHLTRITLDATGEGSVSNVLAVVHGTHVRPGSPLEMPDARQCERLVSALETRSTLLGTRVTLYRVETTGRNGHLFAGLATPVVPEEPGTVSTGHDLVFVLDADYQVLFYTSAVGPHDL